MTHEDIRAEVEKQPFTPFRLHLVSGKEIDVRMPNTAFMLRNALMLFHGPGTIEDPDPGYDLIALRNIERLEQLIWPTRTQNQVAL